MARRPRPLTCLHCGEPEKVELFEIWDEGEFMLETCCEGLHESILDAMQDDPEYRTWLLKKCGVEEVMGRRLRRVPDCDGNYRLDFNPDVRPVEFAVAKAFVAEHHEHNDAPIGWRYGAAIWNANTLLGVAMVGRPVARAIPAEKVVEVNRLCLRWDLPAELRWNASSMLYGWAAREAEKRGYEKIITYTLESEPGTALKAAGWIPEAKTKGGKWNTPSRKRRVAAPTCKKIRWARYLKPKKAASPLDSRSGCLYDGVVAPVTMA